MKRLLVFSLLLGLFLYSAAAAKSCVWQVHGKSNSVYLVGSIHLLDKSAYPLPAKMEAAYANSPNLVFELNLDSSATRRAQTFILSKALFQNGKTLKTVLPPQTYQLTDSIASGLGLPIEKFSLFKPWMVSVSLMMVKLQKLGFNPAYGLDRYFFTKGKKEGKRLLNFETVQEQIGFIDSLPLKLQQEMLLQTAREFETMQTEMDKMISAWKNGDTATLEALTFKSFENLPELKETLLVRRNGQWFNKIVSFLQTTQNYCIVAGVGHMIGPEGLVRLLQQAGYKVEQL